MHNVRYEIIWTRTSRIIDYELVDGNIWDSVNSAYHHLNLFRNSGWEGYVREKKEKI